MTSLPADNRLHHIDAMRAIAALCVVIMHFCTRLPGNIVSSSFIGDVLTLDFGRIGVVLFFAISGFVIPGSLQPGQHKAVFWIRRFFRLYPAYWASLCTVILVQWAFIDTTFSFRQILANTTMLQNFLHFENIEGVYWTLKVELVFYVMVFAGFCLGLNDKPAFLVSVSAFFFCIFIFYLDYWTGITTLSHRFIELINLSNINNTSGGTADNHPLPGLLNMNWGNFCGYFSVMFMGATLRLWFIGQMNRTGKCATAILAAGWFIVLPVMGLIGYSRTQDVGLFSMYGSWITALLMFVVLAFLLPIRARAIVWLGVVSYSLYLFHPVVIDILFAFHMTAALASLYPILTLIFCIAISSAVAGMGYKIVEKPAVTVARQLTKRLSKRSLSLQS
ncbi:acyltransferase 3 [Dickeya parazeae Ech586]|uniref:Acyltransferase 3 n=1 Tax=Dickeya zeae (strain Ech586) TaxID=590409 RepID=D2BYD9_DICZ5|nr:acyltransferase [Dickeya parazeae]ACZ76607.1 acyltransferase 3 [Dickeya parazeae Ech586]